MDVPVTLTNTTGNKLVVNAKIKLGEGLESVPSAYEGGVDGIPLRKVVPSSLVVPLNPNAEKRIVFRIKTKQFLGSSSVEIIATGEKGITETFTETTELPVRPASPLQKRTGAGEVAGGATQPLKLPTDFLPASLRSQLVVSRSPMTAFAKDLRYLLQYPYGCLEQTVSAAFPQLYYGDLTATLGQQTGKAAKASPYNPNYHVQEAIRKVEAQQMYNGSLSYWPGGDYDNWWATAYAAHFLLEARQAGFAVNKTVLDRVLGYLQARVRKRETDTYNIIQTGGAIRPVTRAKRETAYSLYVLALAGQPDAVALNYYKANRGLLTEDAQWVLACTFAVAGNQRSFQQLLPARFAPKTTDRRELGGSFASPIRDEALVLNALLAADPDHPQVAALARQLSRQVQAAAWLNTQERAFSLLALGKLAKRNAASTATAALLADGKVMGQFSGKDLSVTNVANRPLMLRTSGSGKLYYFWELEGISPTGRVPEEDQYLRIRREFLNRNGQPVGATSFKQNDLVVVRLTPAGRRNGR